MARFTLPRDIYYGKGSMEELKNLKGKKAVVVIGGGSMKRFGFLDKAVAYLQEAGLEVRLFENVEPDPSVETVMKGAAMMREFEPDWIIAMAAALPLMPQRPCGSFMSTRIPALRILSSPSPSRNCVRRQNSWPFPPPPGTATEVTAFSVITDYAKGIKYPLADFNITPDVAVVDPELAETMPQKLTAHTGMDALTHAVEAYVSTLNSPFTDPLALKAIHMVFDYLPDSYQGGLAAREQMHYAQCLAGMAFSNALLGIVHSMAHKTGAAFSTGHIPHGCANAIYLPFVIQYNAQDETAKGRYADIARSVGMTGSDEELVAALCAKIDAYNDKLNIPHTLKEFGINESEFLQKLDAIAELAVGDACTGSNPRAITPAQMAALLKCTYYGTKVDF